MNQRSGAFWQLPHFREEFIRYLNAKKARTLRQLAARPTEEIRGIFKNVIHYTAFSVQNIKIYFLACRRGI